MATKAVVQTRPAQLRSRRVKFGSITVSAPAPARELVERNVALSSQALARVAKRLARPGINLRAKKNVALYWLDGDDPDVMIRQLNGKTERGALVDGEFKAID